MAYEWNAYTFVALREHYQKAKGEKGTTDKILLNNVWGEALPNETTALMGPR
jgi:hypothetical protein